MNEDLNERVNEALAEIIEEERNNGARIAQIYSKPSCPYCVRAKKLLEDGGFTIVETSAVVERENLIERVTNITGNAPRTVPQIFIDDEYIGGHDDLVEWLKDN